MMENNRLIIELFFDLKRVMQQLMEHDIEDENKVLVLHRLQVEQLEICEELVRYKDMPKSQEVQRIAHECRDLELLFNERLNNFQLEVKKQIDKFNQVDQFRNAYNHSFQQTEGYFVDRRK
jgi:hypothetical protein